MNRGRLREAAEAFAEARSLDPDLAHARWRAAQVEILEGRAERARQRLHELVHDHPRTLFMVTLGQACSAAGDVAAAEYWLRRAEAIMVDHLEDGTLGHVRELVELWTMRGEEAERAVELSMKELREVRADPRTLETAAWAMHRAGRTDRAIELIERSLAGGAGSTSGLWRAAEIHAVAGDRVRSARLREAALARCEYAERLAWLVSP